MKTTVLRVAAAAALLCPFGALAGHRVDVEVYDRTSHRVLPVYWHEGERHVAGEPGHEYEIRIRNHSFSRVLAVTSVDGVNVVTGRTASPDQGGYVLDPQDRVDIDGWRKSLEEVASFYFTSVDDSYAARTGRPDHVGVIGVAVFREERRFMPMIEGKRRSSRVPAPDAAPVASADEKLADSAGSQRAESRLGTGHGERRDSAARWTHFERASDEPDEIIRIYYDSRRNLVARGVIPHPFEPYAWHKPEPFPEGFVPDP
jgi:hypothetical protein